MALTPKSNPDTGVRRTSLSVREMRADIVAKAIREHPAALTLEDVAGLPRVAGWDPHILAVAIGDLVEAGRLDDGPCGHLQIEDA